MNFTFCYKCDIIPKIQQIRHLTISTCYQERVSAQLKRYFHIQIQCVKETQSIKTFILYYYNIKYTHDIKCIK